MSCVDRPVEARPLASDETQPEPDLTTRGPAAAVVAGRTVLDGVDVGRTTVAAGAAVVVEAGGRVIGSVAGAVVAGAVDVGGGFTAAVTG
jgi:hypothetical protein